MRRRSIFDSEEPIEEEKKPKIKTKKTKMIKVEIDNYNVRSGPGFEFYTKGFIAPGTYNIVEEQNGFGKLEDDLGWVFLEKLTAL